MPDALTRRFGATAALVGARQDARAATFARLVGERVPAVGNERVLDVGTGAGALAIALAPRVCEVVAVDVVSELLAQARARVPPSVCLMHADACCLPFDDESFDLVCCARVLHHVASPAVVLAEMERVLRAGGRMLVIDQLAPADPIAAATLQRFERARDASTCALLSDAELRSLLRARGLVLTASVIDREPRELDDYLDAAGCQGEARESARMLAPSDYCAEVGWYSLSKPPEG